MKVQILDNGMEYYNFLDKQLIYISDSRRVWKKQDFYMQWMRTHTHTKLAPAGLSHPKLKKNVMWVRTHTRTHTQFAARVSVMAYTISMHPKPKVQIAGR